MSLRKIATCFLGLAAALSLLAVGWHLARPSSRAATLGWGGTPVLKIETPPEALLSEERVARCQVFAARTGPTVIGLSQSFAFTVRNEGDAPLELTLDGVSCGCVKSVMLGSRPLVPGTPVVLLPDVRDECLVIQWKVNPDDFDPAKKAQSGRLSVRLKTSDPRQPLIRLELESRLVEADEWLGSALRSMQ